jgi:hypothetical protein
MRRAAGADRFFGDPSAPARPRWRQGAAVAVLRLPVIRARPSSSFPLAPQSSAG